MSPAGAPEYPIDTDWMNRVEEVTDWALEREFYVVLNIHHDSWLWISRMGNSQQETLDKRLSNVSCWLFPIRLIHSQESW